MNTRVELTRELPRQDDERYRPVRMIKKVFFNENVYVNLIVLACLVTVVALAVFLNFENAWGLDLFRTLIIIIFTILPAVMYYVFISSKKSSLFQEFVSNLSRLGLLEHDCGPCVSDSGARDGSRYFKRMRILSYIDQFESAFGPVGSDRKRELLKATLCTTDDVDRKLELEQAGGRILSPATGVPVYIATFLIGLGWVQFIPPIDIGQSIQVATNASFHSKLLYNEMPALFAFLGAYFFSLQMIYRRYVTNDLRSNAFISVSIRITLGVIGACVLQVLFSLTEFSDQTQWLLVASFVIGAFPPVLWRIVREASRRVVVLGNFVPSLDADLPLSELDGLTIWHQTRLEEEDVENTHNMANANIIGLLVNTKMPPERIVSWIDQAILYSVVSDEAKDDSSKSNNMRKTLSNSGIKTASGLQSVVIVKDSDKICPDAKASSAFKDTDLKSLLIGIQNFSNLDLINNWRKKQTQSHWTTSVSANSGTGDH